MRYPEFDYTFSFGPIQSQKARVTQINHLLNDKVENFAIDIQDSSLWLNGFSPNSSISADLLDLAVAIHAVDRLVDRPIDRSLSFRLELQVRNFDVFARSDIGCRLTQVLKWYTDDDWHFEFSKRTDVGREVEIQYGLSLEEAFQHKAEVALWSSGLDSLAGLYTRLKSDPESHYILVGTGSNSHVHTKQIELAKNVEHLFPKRTLLRQIPYGWTNTPTSRKNFYARSRGLVFMLIGAACAHYAGRDSLFIYENGIGAINLPYSKSQGRLDQAKSVHPLSLLYVSELVSAILTSSFEIINPYWLCTKAQMVQSLNDLDGIKLIKLSSSCDRVHRLEDGITQCGICTSCLLRRQSITAAGIDDPTVYDDLCISKNGDHLCAMTYQVNTLRRLLNQHNPWPGLSLEYHDLDKIVDCLSRNDIEESTLLKKQIIQLYSKYVDEWKVFEEYEKTI